MSKWKCEICNSSFENFDARGFDNKIYCPLCYYKKLYKDTELEIERLNNIINELEKYLGEFDFTALICGNGKAGKSIELGARLNNDFILDKLKELKGSDKE